MREGGKKEYERESGRVEGKMKERGREEEAQAKAGGRNVSGRRRRRKRGIEFFFT